MGLSNAADHPIFIHSLFRSASTYFFNKFRLLGSNYTCYQEPFNEILLALNNPARHHALLDTDAAKSKLLRHPKLDKPYFYEFWAIRDRLQHLFRKSFSYEDYFVGDDGPLPVEQLSYIRALIGNASARPLLQFCRSSGRINALRQAFGGVHVHLWREPRVQWWSYKVAAYFDSVSQKIYFSNQIPRSLREIAHRVGVQKGKPQQRSSSASYMMFYGLWLDAWLRLDLYADLSISIDAASAGHSEKLRKSRELGDLVGCAIDLSDLRECGMVLTTDEEAFYADIESAVNDIFIKCEHCSARRLREASRAAVTAREAHFGRKHDAEMEQKLRHTALALMDRLTLPDRSGRHNSSRFRHLERFHDQWRSWSLRLTGARYLPEVFLGSRASADGNAAGITSGDKLD
jgi:hypothetical protein